MATSPHAERSPQQHTPRAIRQRLHDGMRHSYLGDMVLGAIDGTVTTFAVVSGVEGGGLPGAVALLLGAANLLGDGFSMAVGNYLGTRSEQQRTEQVRKIEADHIDHLPEGEREEIRQIFGDKGFSGHVLEEVVRVITRDRRRWIDTMVTEEWGLAPEQRSAVRAGLATFVAFVVAGLILLVPFVLAMSAEQHRFLVSSAITAATFWLIGMLKGRVVGQSMIRSGLETLAVGTIAAGLAYGVGAVLRGLVSA